MGSEMTASCMDASEIAAFWIAASLKWLLLGWLLLIFNVLTKLRLEKPDLWATNFFLLVFQASSFLIYPFPNGFNEAEHCHLLCIMGVTY